MRRALFDGPVPRPFFPLHLCLLLFLLLLFLLLALIVPICLPAHSRCLQNAFAAGMLSFGLFQFMSEKRLWLEDQDMNVRPPPPSLNMPASFHKNLPCRFPK